jgi:hypothetical protein
MSTSLGPMLGIGTSSIQSPGSRLLLTRAFMAFPLGPLGPRGKLARVLRRFRRPYSAPLPGRRQAENT